MQYSAKQTRIQPLFKTFQLLRPTALEDQPITVTNDVFEITHNYRDTHTTTAFPLERAGQNSF